MKVNISWNLCTSNIQSTSWSMQWSSWSKQPIQIIEWLDLRHRAKKVDHAISQETYTHWTTDLDTGKHHYEHWHEPWNAMRFLINEISFEKWTIRCWTNLHDIINNGCILNSEYYQSDNCQMIQTYDQINTHVIVQVDDTYWIGYVHSLNHHDVFACGIYMGKHV